MRFHIAIVCVAGLACALSAAAATAPVPQILVLSNRADLISGGDALVEIKFPPGTPIAVAKIALNNVSVRPMFDMRANGRYMGLVTGLVAGPNLLTVRVPGGGAQITITNHPIGGPVISGPQLNPWICATKVAKSVTVVGNPGSTPPTATANTRANGLNDDPGDDQCNTPPTYTYFYQPVALQGSNCAFATSGANACFTAYNPAARPDDSAIANFTNDRGVTVKSLIRVERGSINRTIYQLVSYFDPRDANTPWDPPKGWNGKLVWQFGASSLFSRFEQSPSRSLFDASGGVGLSRGFMVAVSSLTDHGTNANDHLAAETMMMVKERIAEQYGQIRYTIGDGCSGGANMQHVIANAYPGLIDGLQPQCSFQDTMGSTFIEIADCGDLQSNYYPTANGSTLTLAQRSAINGHKNTGFCQTWITSFLSAGDPTRTAGCGTGFPSALVYSASNPHGIRCDGYDHDVNMGGTSVDVDGITKANNATDNIGLQYGLKPLRAGVISAEEFVKLNEGAGGYNNDLKWTPKRSAITADVARLFYSSGMIADGRQIAKTPIIDLRGNEAPSGDIHANWRPWGMRDRLDRDHGGHANQLIWAFNSASGSTAPGAALTRKAFLTMDAWLAAIEADTSNTDREVKVVVNKPAGAADMCLTTIGATDADLANPLVLDDPNCPVKYESSPRQAGDGPLAENVIKCALKPLQFGDAAYGGVLFTDAQKARLLAVFPTGVCDWSQPGQGQVPTIGWPTFMNGPGGQSLGPAPVSTAFP